METRARMVEAARDLLVEGGLQSFSMRKVAARCDVSATAIYRHFDNKDALVTEAVRAGFRLFAEYLMACLKETTPAARFRSILERYFAFALEHPNYYSLMFMTRTMDLGLEQLEEHGKEELTGTFQLLVDRIAEGQRAGTIREGDGRELSANVWSALHGLAALHITGNLGVDEDTYRALMAQHIGLIERGISPAAS